MQDKSILGKIKSRWYHLNNVVAKNIDKTPEGSTIDIGQNTECSILKNTEDYLSIKVNIQVFVKPEALFSMDLEYIIEFELEEKITDGEIDDNIDILISPLEQETSYLIATLTKYIIGTYIILPPQLEVSEIKRG